MLSKGLAVFSDTRRKWNGSLSVNLVRLHDSGWSSVWSEGWTREGLDLTPTGVGRGEGSPSDSSFRVRACLWRVFPRQDGLYLFKPFVTSFVWVIR